MTHQGKNIQFSSVIQFFIDYFLQRANPSFIYNNNARKRISSTIKFRIAILPIRQVASCLPNRTLKPHQVPHAFKCLVCLFVYFTAPLKRFSTEWRRINYYPIAAPIQDKRHADSSNTSSHAHTKHGKHSRITR